MWSNAVSSRRGRPRTRLRCVLLTSACFLVLTAGAGPASAQPATSAERRRLQDDLTTQRAVAIARERRIAEEREERLFAQLDERDRRLRALLRDVQRSGADAAARRAEVDALVAERSTLVETIAQRDRAYAAEVAEFRRQAAGLIETDSPELLKALQAFADGDRVAAFPVIESIVRAETRAADRATAVHNAAKIQEIAALALTMRDRGEKTTADVIPLLEETQRLDPSYFWGWFELSRLLDEAGALDRSRTAAERALAEARDERETSVSQRALGRLLVKSGDLARARALFEQSLAASERAARDEPANPVLASDVSVSLVQLADVLMQSGDFHGARGLYERALANDERLARAQPDDAEAKREVGVTLRGFGYALRQMGDLAGSRTRFEQALHLHQELAALDPASVRAKGDVASSQALLGDALLAAGELTATRSLLEQAVAAFDEIARANPSSERERDLNIALMRLGEVLAEAGDLPAARATYERALRLEQLVRSNATSAQAWREASFAMSGLAEVLVELGDLLAARARYEQAIAVRERLARDTPDSALAQRDLSEALTRHGRILAVTGDPAAARAALERALGIDQQLLRTNATDAASRTGAAEALMALGMLARSTGDFGGARAHLEGAMPLLDRLLRDAPGNVQIRTYAGSVLETLAEVLLASGDIAAARARYEQALGTRAEVLSKSGATGDAEPVRDLVRVRLELAKLLAERDRPASREHAEAAIRLVEEHGMTPKYLAGVLITASFALEPAASRAALDRAASLVQRQPGGENDAGWILLLSGRFEDADAHFTRLLDSAASTDPDRAVYLGNLVNARLLRGEVESAAALVRQGLALDGFAAGVRQDLQEFRRRGFSTVGFDRIEALLDGR